MNDKVCIVTPFHKSNLNESEKLSLKTIQKHFKNEKKFLVTFDENKIDLPNFERINFSKIFFENIQGYNNLCTSAKFYRSFIDFEYILICQLDVIVLKNDLSEFISKNISYIGAPTGKKSPFDRSRKKLWGRRYFCNGGFSLRKTNDFIRVLESSKIGYPFNYLTIYECLKSGFYRYIKLYLKTLFSKNIYKGESFAKNLYIKEDSFWTYFAPLFYKKYSLPTIDQANSFCFDGNPNFFYKMNKYKLPMALHGPFDYLKFLEKLNIQI
tara:strand:- start:842 stop:1645 length:804 start_codon:yes stop_codon:yes gene_type:complete